MHTGFEAGIAVLPVEESSLLKLTMSRLFEEMVPSPLR